MVVVEALALLLVAFVPSHALHALADLNVEPWPGFGLFWMAEPNGKPLESHEKPWKPPQVPTLALALNLLLQKEVLQKTGQLNTTNTMELGTQTLVVPKKCSSETWQG